MAPLVSTIEIARRPAEVFALATDPLRFAEWQRDVVGVRMLGEQDFATIRRFGGTEVELTQRVVRDEPPHRWAARGIDGPLRPYATIAVEPVDGGARSRVTFTLDFEGHGIGAPLVPLVRRQAEKGSRVSYRNLRTLLEGDRAAVPAAARRTATGRMTGYWAATALVTAELAVGGGWDVLRTPQVRSIVEHLGYPSYFLVVLGIWKLLGAVALLVPRFPLLKEWAYAGVIFTDTGAVASHLTTGYGSVELGYLIPLAGLTVLSWAWRPAPRRTPRRATPTG